MSIIDDTGSTWVTLFNEQVRVFQLFYTIPRRYFFRLVVRQRVALKLSGHLSGHLLLQAEKLLGRPARDLFDMRSGNDFGEYERVFADCLFKPFIAKVR